MILKRVKIKNFRIFKDADIDFGHLDNEKITVILGNKGTGKTTLINAIYWCLYGIEAITPLHLERRPICNEKTRYLANIGDEIEVMVELEFLDNEERLMVNRVLGFVKTENGLIPEHSLDNFDLAIEEGDEFRLCEHPDYIIQSRFPKDILFFDSLRLIFARNGLEFKKLILSLSQINLVENAYKNISKMERYYIHRQKEICPNIAALNEKISILEERIRESKEKLEIAQNQINEINDGDCDIEEKLRGHGIDNIPSPSINFKTDLSKKINNLESRIEIDEDTLDNQKSLFNENYKKILESEEYQKKIDFCRETSIAAKDLYDNLSGNFRGKVQELLKDNFFKMSWKGDTFVDIIIDKNFDIFIKNKLGNQLEFINLSHGEQFYFGLCFILALYDIYGFCLPVILENPMYMLDMDMKRNFTEVLTHFADGKQFILILNYEEYNDVRNILQSIVGREYEIIYHGYDNGQESEVI